MGRDLKDSDFRSLSEQVTQVGVTCLRQVDQRTEYACEPRLSAKFAPEAVAIQKESAVFLNLLLDRSKMLGVEDISQFDMTDELSRLPHLRRFFARAEGFARKEPTESPNTASAQLLPGLGQAVCGYYPNPKPAVAVAFKEFTRSDPAGTLRSLGYHETPGLAGGGWTRPQTYNPAICGFSTYRDHALITGPTTLREQNYTETPGGEPNPEVYRSGPWPYLDWPVYVFWWHQTH